MQETQIKRYSLSGSLLFVAYTRRTEASHLVQRLQYFGATSTEVASTPFFDRADRMSSAPSTVSTARYAERQRFRHGLDHGRQRSGLRVLGLTNAIDAMNLP